MSRPGRDARRASTRRLSCPISACQTYEPELPRRALYAERIARLRARMDRDGHDVCLVYADREHSANISYLTGFDPRFEEALLVVGRDDDPAILVGNECWGTAGAAPLPMRRHLFQDFSLPSQPRDRSRTLSEILAAEGIAQRHARRSRRLEDLSRAVDERRAGIHRRHRARASPAQTTLPTSPAAHRCPRRTARHQRARADRVPRMGACHVSEGVRNLLSDCARA